MLNVSSFTGKKALVTGAGKGIGRAVAKALSERGAEVMALSRTQADLDSLKTEVPTIKTICIDLCDFEKVQRVIEDLGDIDLFVNNAAVISHMGSLLDVTMEAFDKVFDVNIKAAFFVVQAVGKKMVSRGKGGSIVNVSTAFTMSGHTTLGIYTSTKAALDMVTKCLALELGKHKIRVNSVNPTIVWTDLARQAFPDPAMLKPTQDRVPLGRFNEVEDVVQPILYLLSDNAAMVHGTFFLVDGGQNIS